jgi:hypothetical protein
VDGKNCLVNPFSGNNSQKCKVVSDNITDELRTQNGEKGDSKGKKSLELSIIDIQKEKEHKKKERTEKLIKSRQVYAETWKTFKVVKNHLENQGIEVIDSRYEKSGTGLDGRKLLKLIRYLLTNEVKELNLAGWGRYAKPLEETLKEVGLIGDEVKIIYPKSKNLEDLEVEVLRALSLSEEEISKYIELSEEGKLEFLEKKGMLEEYQRELERKEIGIKGNLYVGDNTLEDEDRIKDDDEEEIPF